MRVFSFGLARPITLAGYTESERRGPFSLHFEFSRHIPVYILVEASGEILTPREFLAATRG